jgi:hypothetical protein
MFYWENDMSTAKGAHESGRENNLTDDSIEVIRRALLGLCYGSIEIVVHDSRVVQVERKEKIRLLTDRPQRR